MPVVQKESKTSISILSIGYMRLYSSSIGWKSSNKMIYINAYKKGADHFQNDWHLYFILPTVLSILLLEFADLHVRVPDASLGQRASLPPPFFLRGSSWPHLGVR
jgi:hypothetical protein